LHIPTSRFSWARSESAFGHLGHLLHPPPLRRDDEQRATIRPTQHAGEAPAVELDGLQHFAAFAHAHAALVRHVGIPDRALGIEADAVGRTVSEVGPHAAMVQAAVGRDVEGGELSAVRLGNDQAGVVGRDGHAVRKGDAVGHLACAAVRADERDEAGAAVHVDMAAPVHHDLVPGAGGESAQVGVGRERAVGLLSQQPPLAPVHDEQAAVGQPGDAEGQAEGRAQHHLGAAVGVDGEDLLRAPVGEPQAMVVPARRFAHREPGQQGARCGGCGWVRAHESS